MGTRQSNGIDPNCRPKMRTRTNPNCRADIVLWHSSLAIVVCLVVTCVTNHDACKLKQQSTVAILRLSLNKVRDNVFFWLIFVIIIVVLCCWLVVVFVTSASAMLLLFVVLSAGCCVAFFTMATSFVLDAVVFVVSCCCILLLHLACCVALLRHVCCVFVVVVAPFSFLAV